MISTLPGKASRTYFVESRGSVLGVKNSSIYL